MGYGCLYQCKDTKFLAIHNLFVCLIFCFVLFISVQRYEIFSNSQQFLSFMANLLVVYISAKIRNFQQFTTLCLRIVLVSRLFISVQRYEIFSNSQRLATSSMCCLVVYISAKIRNFQQFTTNIQRVCKGSQLFISVQRYEIFSNSQRR